MSDTPSMQCIECGLSRGHRINCGIGNAKARAYQDKLKREWNRLTKAQKLKKKDQP